MRMRLFICIHYVDVMLDDIYHEKYATKNLCKSKFKTRLCIAEGQMESGMNMKWNEMFEEIHRCTKTEDALTSNLKSIF